MRELSSGPALWCPSAEAAACLLRRDHPLAGSRGTNSPDNPYNPDPTTEVRFGEPTTAEMMFGFVRYAYVKEPT